MADAEGAGGLAAWAAARGMTVEDGVHLPRTTPLLAEGEVHSVDALAGGWLSKYLEAKVALIDRGETLGGVCLNVGCIPSKALLHVARVLAESEELSASGVSFARPDIDVDELRGWKESVVGRLTGGLAGLARQRKVQVIRGDGGLTGPNVITVKTDDGETSVGFEHCIIAAGSSPASALRTDWSRSRASSCSCVLGPGAGSVWMTGSVSGPKRRPARATAL